ncbi:hypothetical protein J4032_20080 [Streptomyces formicae]|uniref:Glucose-methanol-choline oxidoreductase C-terminal domain-containing protein n=2 Tax=Streptomyces formicae TaxID=1616117 RepID=A0ABY3WLH2_9ACTN|nr:hypothetical protein J4032_20080 [Streptomyces formicae]
MTAGRRQSRQRTPCVLDPPGTDAGREPRIYSAAVRRARRGTGDPAEPPHRADRRRSLVGRHRAGNGHRRAARLPGPHPARRRTARTHDREQTRAFLRDACLPYQHTVGTCAMGSGPEAVVDARLRVRGIDGLRVADASVTPSITSANTNAPSVMIGEAAARLLAGEQEAGVHDRASLAPASLW